jgi:hypothetical protein
LPSAGVKQRIKIFTMKAIFMFEFLLGLAWAISWSILGCMAALRRWWL